MSDILEFIKGQEDCEESGIAKEGQADAYYSGFNFSYQMGEILNNRDMKNELSRTH